MSSEGTASKQREIQKQVEKADRKQNPKSSGAMQAGARRYPEPPFPKVHEDKPGSEADLPPKGLPFERERQISNLTKASSSLTPCWNDWIIRLAMSSCSASVWGCRTEMT
jgi:hypothetical protein